MKKFILAFLNDLLVVWSVILADYMTSKNVVLGMVFFIIAFMLLDAHTYFSKKLNFFNNIFIKD